MSVFISFWAEKYFSANIKVIVSNDNTFAKFKKIIYHEGHEEHEVFLINGLRCCFDCALSACQLFVFL